MGLKPNDSLLNGKYLIEGVLGRGGFGFVYLARDTLLGRPVAIKEMNPTLALRLRHTGVCLRRQCGGQPGLRGR